MGFGDSLGGLLGGSSSTSGRPQINKAQKPFLENLWGGGQNLLNQQLGGGFGQEMFGNANQLYGQGQGFLNQLSGPYQQSESAQAQIGSMAQQVGQYSDRAMNQVGQQGIMAGQFGQPRGQIGRGMVAEGAQNAIAQGAGQIMGQDQGIQAQSALGGLNSLQGMFGLGQSPYMSQWLPYQMQAGIIGNPAMESKNSSSAWNLSGGK
jgi:hypothetical protein